MAARALNRPGGHGLHSGCMVAVPGASVNSPLPHLMCSWHTALTDSEALRMWMEGSAGVVFLHQPVGQGAHTGVAMVLPSVL